MYFTMVLTNWLLFFFFFFFFFEKPDQRPKPLIQNKLKLNEHHEELKGQCEMANHVAKSEPQQLA